MPYFIAMQALEFPMGLVKPPREATKIYNLNYCSLQEFIVRSGPTVILVNTWISWTFLSFEVAIIHVTVGDVIIKSILETM